VFVGFCDHEEDRLVWVGFHDSDRVKLSPAPDKERLGDTSFPKNFGML
jgi:hypothetical protein